MFKENQKLILFAHFSLSKNVLFLIFFKDIFYNHLILNKLNFNSIENNCNIRNKFSKHFTLHFQVILSNFL